MDASTGHRRTGTIVVIVLLAVGLLVGTSLFAYLGYRILWGRTLISDATLSASQSPSVAPTSAQVALATDAPTRTALPSASPTPAIPPTATVAPTDTALPSVSPTALAGSTSQSPAGAEAETTPAPTPTFALPERLAQTGLQLWPSLPLLGLALGGLALSVHGLRRRA